MTDDAKVPCPLLWNQESTDGGHHPFPPADLEQEEVQERGWQWQPFACDATSDNNDNATMLTTMQQSRQ
jgi:hypothetical protein